MTMAHVFFFHNKHIIICHPNAPMALQPLIVAHELSHILLGHNKDPSLFFSADESNAAEFYAKTISYLFWLPPKIIKPFAPKPIPDQNDIENIAAKIYGRTKDPAFKTACFNIALLYKAFMVPSEQK